MTMILADPSHEYSEHELETLFEVKHGKDPESEVQVPLKVSVGITLSLCGYLLSQIPHPYCKAASLFLIPWGIQIATDAGLDEINRQSQNKN